MILSILSKYRCYSSYSSLNNIRSIISLLLKPVIDTADGVNFAIVKYQKLRKKIDICHSSNMVWYTNNITVPTLLTPAELATNCGWIAPESITYSEKARLC